MIRVKLPFGGINAGADGGLRRRGREVRPAAQGPHHDAPELPVPPRAAARRRGHDPRHLGRRPVEPRGLRQHRPQRDRATRGRACARARCSIARRTRAPTSATSCATPRRSSCRARSRRRSTARPRTARSPRSTTSPSARRSRTARRASRCSSAAARRSCRAPRRSSTTSSRPTTVSTSRPPRPSCGSSTARIGCAPNRARARIKVFVDKFGIDELRRQADEERKGDWVKERDFDVAPAALRRRRGGGRHQAADGPGLRPAERRPVRVQALGRAQRQAAEAGRLQHRPGEGRSAAT